MTDDRLSQTLTLAKLAISREDRDAEAIRAFLYESPGLMFLKDYTEELSAGRYVFVSREWERVYSRKKAQVIGFNDYDIFQRSEADKRTLDEKQTLEFGRPTTVADPVGTSGSHWKPFRYALIPIRLGSEDRHTYIGGYSLAQELRY